MKLIRFLKLYPPYNGGETAGFDDARAEMIVASGAAQYVEPVREEPMEVAVQAPAPENAMRRGPKRGR